MNPQQAQNQYTSISVPVLMAFETPEAIQLYALLKRLTDSSGSITQPGSYSVAIATINTLLSCPADYDSAELLNHELYWAQLELAHRGPFSFVAAPVAGPAGEPAINFLINHQLAPSAEFGYLLVARNETHDEGIYLITATRKDPEAYLSSLSSQEATPGDFTLQYCFPVRHTGRVKQRCRMLLADVKSNLQGNFYRLSPAQAQALSRRLASRTA